ncbi:hypothetical protein AQPW35_08070 [Rubrivivax pictus]|uniref:Uncharacterized protein n=1 Tax=Pseudaquabacterium pictum TaxID=2315236 RepID=A0A480AL58_9BURK|nr:hypothetical protein AQPW35_08070 [Rubrivivax pictus]
MATEGRSQPAIAMTSARRPIQAALSILRMLRLFRQADGSRGGHARLQTNAPTARLIRVDHPDPVFECVSS